MAQDETEQTTTRPAEESNLRPCLMVLSGLSVGAIYRLDKPTSVVGRADDADIVLSDRGISRRHAQFTVCPDGAVTVSDLESTNGTFLGVERIRSVKLSGGERLRLGASVKLKFDFRDPSEEQLLESVTRDPLTGALHRGYFDQRFHEAVARCRRYGTTLTCAFIDVDHFKSFNDTHGHAVGDEVLRELVRRIHILKRQEDVFARYGGEEFVMLLPETNLNGAELLLERIRSAIADEPFLAAEKALTVTASIGLASASSAFDGAELLEAADEALYRAKAEGRNRVVSGLHLPVKHA